MSKNKVVYDKVFEFDFTGQVQVGPLSEAALHKLFKDGRIASHFLEQCIPLWFSDLTFVDKKGYDHEDSTGHKYDLKGFTVRGASYVPSKMLGAGRKINLVEVENHAKYISYIFSDITNFPKVRIVFKTGKVMLKNFPSGKVKSNEIDKLFQ